MGKLRPDGLNAEKIGAIAEFGHESENDYWERTHIEKEDEEIRGFVKCHPMPSPDDEEGNKFRRKVFDRLTEAEGINGMIICLFVRCDTMKKIHENLTD